MDSKVSVRFYVRPRQGEDFAPSIRAVVVYDKSRRYLQAYPLAIPLDWWKYITTSGNPKTPREKGKAAQEAYAVCFGVLLPFKKRILKLAARLIDAGEWEQTDSKQLAFLERQEMEREVREAVKKNRGEI